MNSHLFQLLGESTTPVHLHRQQLRYVKRHGMQSRTVLECWRNAALGLLALISLPLYAHGAITRTRWATGLLHLGAPSARVLPVFGSALMVQSSEMCAQGYPPALFTGFPLPKCIFSPLLQITSLKHLLCSHGECQANSCASNKMYLALIQLLQCA